MMKKNYHIKKGDKVEVITGSYKGKTATVSVIIKKKDRVVLSEISSGVMKTVRKTQENPHGGLVERAVTVHVSNVKKIEG
jgi:large subunit ribosomal protein L24